jgi:WXXGXW repeat (2 copies)
VLLSRRDPARAALKKDPDMRRLRNGIAALVIGFWPHSALVAPAFAQTCACAPGGGYVIEADEPPPPLPEYDQPPLPAPGYYWTPGYWAWNNYDYYWVPGAWVEPPQPGLLWTPGYWAFAAGAYAFRPGYWGPHVGYYGGIDYGFGYSGTGYVGGRWDNDRFFYNDRANNLGAARIANVYSQPVVNSATINRTSFNGGAGGVAAKPTNEELLAEKETHVPPTRLQVDHARSSSMRGEQFRSTNNGKPAVAATPRPGEFKGKGVVPATAAGKSAETPPAPGGTGEPPPKERPRANEQPNRNEAAPSAPRTEEMPPAAGQPMKSEAPTNAPRREKRSPVTGQPVAPETPANAPRTEERAPNLAQPVKPEAPLNAPRMQERAPTVGQPGKPEAPASAPRFDERRPPNENLLRQGPQNGVQRFERPPGAQPKPEGRPEAKECGRPGLPPCPR